MANNLSKFGDPSLKEWELWCGQDRNGVNFDFKLNGTFEVKVNHPHKTKGILPIVFCTSGPNLMILA